MVEVNAFGPKQMIISPHLLLSHPFVAPLKRHI